MCDSVCLDMAAAGPSVKRQKSDAKRDIIVVSDGEEDSKKTDHKKQDTVPKVAEELPHKKKKKTGSGYQPAYERPTQQPKSLFPVFSWENGENSGLRFRLFDADAEPIFSHAVHLLFKEDRIQRDVGPFGCILTTRKAGKYEPYPPISLKWSPKCGGFQYGGTTIKTHIVGCIGKYKAAGKGPWPRGHEVSHLCHNPTCVKPVSRPRV